MKNIKKVRKKEGQRKRNRKEKKGWSKNLEMKQKIRGEKYIKKEMKQDKVNTLRFKTTI